MIYTPKSQPLYVAQTIALHAHNHAPVPSDAYPDSWYGLAAVAIGLFFLRALQRVCDRVGKAVEEHKTLEYRKSLAETKVVAKQHIEQK